MRTSLTRGRRSFVSRLPSSLLLPLLVAVMAPGSAAASSSATATKSCPPTSTTLAAFTLSTAQTVSWSAVYDPVSGCNGNGFFLSTDGTDTSPDITLTGSGAPSGTQFLNPGTYHISINFFGMGQGSYTVTYDQTATIAASPLSHDFAAQVAGTTSAPFTFSVSSTGDLPVTIANVVSSDPAHFPVSAVPAGQQLPPTRTFQVRFVAGAVAGAFGANISISGTSALGAVTPLTVSVHGQTQPSVPNIACSGNPSIGKADWSTGEVAVLTRSFQNTGSAPLLLTAVQVINDSPAAPFSAASPPSLGQVGSGATRNVSIRFAPPLAGGEATYSGHLQIQSNDPNQPVKQCSFNALAHHPVPIMHIEHTELDYGQVETGFSFTKVIVIHNDGDADLVVSAASASAGSPDLSQWPLSELASGVTIAPLAAPLALKQTFVPTALGAHQVGITITSNDLTQPSVLVELKGTGISPIPIDSVLVLDRSGSMSESSGDRQKIEALASGSDLFANLLRPDHGSGTGDKIALVKFNDLPELYVGQGFVDDPSTPGSHLALVDSKLDPAALTDPNGLQPSGSTGIGGAMQIGAAQLPLPANGRKHVMVVLTDGIENTAPFIDSVLPAIHGNDPGLRIYSVGIGADVDPAKLQEITNVTNGYHQVSDGLTGTSLYDLETFYFKIFANASDLQIAVDPTRPVPITGTAPIVVDRARISSSDHRATFLVLDLPHQRGFYELQLLDPNGNVIGPGSMVGGVPVVVVHRDTYTIYKAVFPSDLASAAYVGDWVLRLTPLVIPSPAVRSAGAVARAADSGIVQVGFGAVVGSDYRLDLRVVSATYLPGSPVTVSAAPTDSGLPVTEAHFSVDVTAPDHTTYSLTLYDDGTHGDPIAGDGQWTGQLPATAQSGSYRVFVHAVAHNSQGEVVVREATRYISLGSPACPAGCGGANCGVSTGSGGTGGTGGRRLPFFLVVESGAGWPVGATRHHYGPGLDFTGLLEVGPAPFLRLGLQAGYHAFAAKPPVAGGDLGVTNLSLTGRVLGSGPYRPFVLVGIGGYHALSSWRLGGELGLGLDAPITHLASLVTGAAFHSTATFSSTTGRLQWIDGWIGLSLRLP